MSLSIYYSSKGILNLLNYGYINLNLSSYYRLLFIFEYGNTHSPVVSYITLSYFLATYSNKSSFLGSLISK